MCVCVVPEGGCLQRPLWLQARVDESPFANRTRLTLPKLLWGQCSSLACPPPTARFALLAYALNKDIVGIEFKTAIEELMQRSASDDLADTRYNDAAAAFNDNNIFQIVVDGGASISIQNAAVVLGRDKMVYAAWVQVGLSRFAPSWSSTFCQHHVV